MSGEGGSRARRSVKAEGVKGQAGDALAAGRAWVPPVGWGRGVACHMAATVSRSHWEMERVPTVPVCPGPRCFPRNGTARAETRKVLATQNALATRGTGLSSPASQRDQDCCWYRNLISWNRETEAERRVTCRREVPQGVSSMASWNILASTSLAFSAHWEDARHASAVC